MDAASVGGGSDRMAHRAEADPDSGSHAVRSDATLAFESLPLRRALGSFATGVTVVSTLAEDGRLVGVTANSFSSVSLEPPIVLWSLNRRSPNLPAFDQGGRFVVNVLAQDQAALSRRFAASCSDKFEGVPMRRSRSGLPILNGCVAHFHCRTSQRLQVGDHVLFLARVEAFEHRPGAGLLFYQGQYARGVSLNASDIP